MSEPHPAVAREAILEVVENQLREGTPPETKQTLERLVAGGQAVEDAKRLLGVVVAQEIFDAHASARIP